MSPPRLLLAVALAAALAPDKGYDLIGTAMSGSEPARQTAARRLAESGDRAFVPALVDALFFLHADEREPLLGALRKLTGEDPGTKYHDWVELVGRRGDLQPAPGYLAWKGSLFGRIDPRYRTLSRREPRSASAPRRSSGAASSWTGFHRWTIRRMSKRRPRARSATASGSSA